MKKYKTELHCHTSEVSLCAGENAEDTIEKYLRYGYSTIVLTNHLSLTSFREELREASWKEKIDFFICGYEKMKKAAAGRMNILLGAEIRFPKNSNDYLLYGIYEDFLYNNENFVASSVEDFYPNHVYPDRLLIQAHPLRPYMTVMPTWFIDGYEVYNGHPDQSSHNDAAKLLAAHYPNKHKTSGTDHHDSDHFPAGGILTENEIRCSDELLSVIRSGDYTLIEDEDIRLGKKRL